MANPLNNRPVTPGNNNQVMQQLSALINQAKMVQNPQAFFQHFGAKNPQAMQQLNALMQGGKTPKQVAINRLQEQGIDIAQIEQMIRG